MGTNEGSPGGDGLRFPTYTPSSGTISGQASALTATAGDPESVAATVGGRYSSAVGGVSGMVQTVMEGEDQEAKDMAVRVARRAISGGAALRLFSTYVEEHDTRVSGWNNQIAAEPEEDRQRKYNQLDPAFQDSLEELRTGSKATTVAGYLRQPLDVETVRSLFTAGMMPANTVQIFPGLPLGGHDQLEAIQARIRNGDLPPLADLSEEERQALLAENPGLLPWLMAKEDPTDEEMSIVRDLAIPHLDGADGEAAGQDVLDALDRDAGPEGFVDALGLVGQFGAYAKWAQQHGGPAIPGSQMDFLRGFYGKTGDRIEDVQEYIADDEHRYLGTELVISSSGSVIGERPAWLTADGFGEGQQQAGLRDFANGLLTLSDHRLGGGWDELPEDVRDAVQERPWIVNTVEGTHSDEGEDLQRIAGLLTQGDIAAGEGLSKELAVSIQQANEEWDAEGYSWNDDLSSDVFELVGRNHQASADLVGGLNEDMPDDYDHRKFLETVYGHTWDDHGAGAAALTDWIHEEHATAGDDQQLANQAYAGLAQGLTSVGDDGIFRSLMGSAENEVAPAGQNYELMNSLVEATSDRLYQFAAEPGSPSDQAGALSPSQEVRLMTLMATDHGQGEPGEEGFRLGSAEYLAGTVDAWQRDQVNEWVADVQAGYGLEDGPRGLAAENGRLQAMLDSALINEATERGINAEAAEEQRIATIKTGAGMVASVAGAIPGVGTVAGPVVGAGNSVLANFLTADHVAPPPADIDPLWQPDGSHVSAAGGRYLVEQMVRADLIDVDDLPPSLTSPGSEPNADTNDDIRELLEQAYPGDPQFFGEFVDENTNVYNQYLQNFSLYQKDEDQITEFLDNENWGRP